MIRSLTFTSLTLILLTGGIVGVSPSALASPSPQGTVMLTPDGLRTQLVRFGDLDLSNDAGSHALYRRIRAAAKRVCTTTDSRPGIRLLTEGQCQRAAVTDAVAAIGSGRLTALHSAQSAPRIAALGKST